MWKVDCSSPSSVSLVQLALPAGNSVVDTGFYTSEFLSLLVEGDGQEGQTLTHLPLVSLAPLMTASPSSSGAPNIATHQVNLHLVACRPTILKNYKSFLGGRSDRRQEPVVRKSSSQEPCNLRPQKGFIAIANIIA